MKSGCRTALLLALWIFPLFCTHSQASAADLQESLFPVQSNFAEPMRGPSETDILRLSSSPDPFTLGCLALGVKPWLDLLDKTSYSLKLSMPIATWRPGFYGWNEEGNSLSAGLLASVQLKAVPPRYGSWVLSTGIFLIKEPTPFDQPLFSEFEYAGGVGAVNIRITY